VEKDDVSKFALIEPRVSGLVANRQHDAQRRAWQAPQTQTSSSHYTVDQERCNEENKGKANNA
jgi:hypothetical protein